MAAFVDPFLLAVTLVMTWLLIFANIYFLARFAHHADSFFGSSTACKAVLVSIGSNLCDLTVAVCAYQVVGYMLAQC